MSAKGLVWPSGPIAAPKHQGARPTDRAAADNARSMLLLKYAARRAPDHLALQRAADIQAEREAAKRAAREAEAVRVAEAAAAAVALVAAQKLRRDAKYAARKARRS